MIKRVKVMEYTGTIESYNDLVERLWDKDQMHHHIWFIDENGDMTPKFTGVVCCAITGVRYRPGDVYSNDD